MKKLLVILFSVFVLVGCATKQPSNNEVAKTELIITNKNNKPSQNKEPIEQVEEHNEPSTNSNTSNTKLEQEVEVKPSMDTKPSTELELEKHQTQEQKLEEVKPSPQQEHSQPQPQPEPAPVPQPQIDLPGDLNHDGYVDQDECDKQSQEELMGFINEYRMQNGLQPLQPLASVQNLADKRAKELITNFSHHSQYDAGAETNLERTSENIASGGSSIGTFRGWKNSVGHNNGMLQPTAVYGAIGYARDDIGRVYWVFVAFSNNPNPWH